MTDLIVQSMLSEGELACLTVLRPKLTINPLGAKYHCTVAKGHDGAHTAHDEYGKPLLVWTTKSDAVRLTFRNYPRAGFVDPPF